MWDPISKTEVLAAGVIKGDEGSSVSKEGLNPLNETRGEAEGRELVEEGWMPN